MIADRSISTAATPWLVAKNVIKRYDRAGDGALLAVDDVSLEIAAGEFCSIVGPSGCGKSTLMMMFAGLYQRSSGTIAVNGKSVDKPLVGVGMVFQRDVLLEWRSVLDNVLLPIEVMKLSKKDYRERALELLDLVGLRDFADNYPDQLSGGMRQRVSICRALVHDPPLLLMDEPFGALDSLTRERMNVDIVRLTASRKQTVVFVTHSIDEAVFMSDRIVVMTTRPARVYQSLTIDLDKPRTIETRSDPRYGRYVADVRSEFHAMGVI